jgi:CheY-like chemotaxis protein
MSLRGHPYAWRAMEPNGQVKRILVVDDDPNLRSSLGRMLTAAGHQVVLAENGMEAILRWQELGADLVMLDLFMPVMDGLETLAALRAYAPRLPIIVMSGGGTKGVDLSVQAKLLGANWTIAKPFSLAAIIALVGSALGAADTGE